MPHLKHRTTSWGNISILVLVIGIVLVACAGPAAQEPTDEPTLLPTSAPEQTTEVIATEAPTAANAPTDAPAATETGEAAEVSFATDVLPILQSRCVNCHGGQRTEKGLNLTSYAHFMAGSEKGPVLVAGDAAGSKFIQLIEQGKMPKRGPKVLPDQFQVLVDWVNAGALNN